MTDKEFRDKLFKDLDLFEKALEKTIDEINESRGRK